MVGVGQYMYHITLGPKWGLGIFNLALYAGFFHAGLTQIIEYL